MNLAPIHLELFDKFMSTGISPFTVRYPKSHKKAITGEALGLVLSGNAWTTTFGNCVRVEAMAWFYYLKCGATENEFNFALAGDDLIMIVSRHKVSQVVDLVGRYTAITDNNPLSGIGY
jgi:hypothetical protein